MRSRARLKNAHSRFRDRCTVLCAIPRSRKSATFSASDGRTTHRPRSSKSTIRVFETRSRILQGLLLLVGVIGFGCGERNEVVFDASFPDTGGGCVVGSLECACGPGGSCALDPDGLPLQCVAGTCLLPMCPPGSPGCDCQPGDRCVEGATCTGGACVLAGCAEGTERCRCAAGGSCDVGLFCRDNAVCVDQTGFEGGACFDNGTCNSGNRCEAGRCVFCDRGTAGCACTDVGTCADGLSCSAGMCVAGSSQPPEEPLCYTPCRRDLLEGVDVRSCSADGLLEGCIDDQSCVRGSCVSPGEEPQGCSSDVDCPFFQTCLAGGCYSNCVNNADCPTGLGCHLRVCRTPCSLGTGTASCPTGQSCDSRDGESGFCVPTAPPTGEPPAVPPEPTFEIDRASTFELSNIRTSARIRLRSTGSGAQRVVIQKVAHRLYDRDGRVEQITSPVDPSTGTALPCEGSATDCPLWWMEMSVGDGERTRGDTLEVLIPGDCDEDCPVVELSGAGGSPGVRYDGRFEVRGPGGTHAVEIGYVEEVAGRWEGQIRYFANFDDEGLDAWLARDDKSNTDGVRNALLQRWGAFRRGNLESWNEFEAVLTATHTGSWSLGRTRELCDAVTGGTSRAACYPFDTPAGVRIYVENTDASPIPSATTELPVALHIRPQEDAPTIFTGRIDSASALQYPGNPAIGLRLAANPSRPGACSDSVASDCVVFARDLSADIAVGGRYVTDSGSCARDYAPFRVPWLVPGLTDGTLLGAGGARERVECRDTVVPFRDETADNIDLAGANPAPDGQPRIRHIELLDGALINQRDLFLLVRETFPSFVPRAEDASAYGFVVLRRTPQDLVDEDFVGTPVAPVERNPPVEGVACSQAVLDALPPAVRSSPTALVQTLIDGSAADPDAFGLTAVPDARRDAQVHYYCDVTDEFDGGGEFTSTDVHLPHACPGGADVRFFFTGGNFSQDEIWREACQTDDALSCAALLERWIDSDLVLEDRPTYRCVDDGRVFCNDNPHNLREGKRFYRRTGTDTPPAMTPLRDQIALAFRYKTQFQSTLMPDGEVGFAPVLCSGSLTPYCYEPEEIDAVRERVDCLVSIYTNEIDEVGSEARGTLNAFVREQFSETMVGAESFDGFERFYAELLVTLGDEELTQAFASRFDLAGVATRTFLGSRFERGGLDLTGVAGAEMQRLYASIQYYQLALDRLYGMGPSIAAALRRGSTNSPQVFISPETVTLYITRLVRASTQKSLAWSEVGRRYLEFQQTRLARRILERAYAQTYLESVLLAQLMTDIADGSSASFRGQIRREIEQALRAYRVAMLDMEDVFDDVVGERTFFGFPPEYVPFPAIDTSTTEFGNNGFEQLLGVARQRLQLAKEREETAIESLSSGRVGLAQFQSELVGVRNTHEDRLAELCGTFVGDDGLRYPAIRRYASLSDQTRLVGDPCALVGNGTIYEEMIGVDLAANALQATLVRLRNAQSEIDDERTRVAEQCRINRENLQYEYDQGATTANLAADLARAQAGFNTATRFLGVVEGGIDDFIQCTTVEFTDDVGISRGICLGLAAGSGVLGVVKAGLETAAEFSSIEKQNEIELKRLETGRFLGDTCPAMTVDSNARIANLVRSLDEIELESIRTVESIRLQLAQVERLRHEASRIEVRQEEAEQLLINVESARNDPNVRIYRNEAVINADIAFDDAARAAYRATRMYEYYTSTSYPRLDELFLVRLAARSRPNLENYLIDLENAFQDFEEEQGLPDLRVAVLSLRDDILEIPLLDGTGRPMAQSERIARMQDALTGSDYLDENGYVTIPFGTSVDDLSPLTRNHKILYLEANMIGSDVGDRLGRIYVRQRGTGVIRTVDDNRDYYVFPERTAVVDTFFNGNRVFPPQVYQNLRLRDRPFVHTMWEMVINQRDESVNRDIDLASLSDVQLLIYYTDFTAI